MKRIQKSKVFQNVLFSIIDTSMANLLVKNRSGFLTSNIKTMHWKIYFGQTEGQSIFSRDAEIKLTSSYNDSVDK